MCSNQGVLVVSLLKAAESELKPELEPEPEPETESESESVTVGYILYLCNTIYHLQWASIVTHERGILYVPQIPFSLSTLYYTLSSKLVIFYAYFFSILIYMYAYIFLSTFLKHPGTYIYFSIYLCRYL